MTTRKRLFDPGCRYTRYFIKILFGLVFIFSRQNAYALNPDSPTIFNRLSQVPQKSRVAIATVLYKDNFRKVSPASAMAGLDKLSALARSLDDKSLECAVFDMRADYYSVNNRFNDKSTAYYQQAIDFAAANNMPVETGLYLHKMGMYYFTFKHNALACRYFLMSQEKFGQIGYDNVPDISHYLSNIADFYYSLGDYDNAKTNLETALRYPQTTPRDRVNIINTIGLIYRNYRQFPMAVSYFNKALALATANRDTVWIGIAEGNIGSVYFLQNQYDKALPYIQTDYKTSIKYDQTLNAAIAVLRLAKINIDSKKFELAGSQLKSAAGLLKDNRNDDLSQWANYYDLKSQLDEQIGKSAESIVYRKKHEQAKDSLAKRNNIAAVERVKLRWESEKRTTELNGLKDAQKIQSVEINAGISVVTLLVIILLLVYNRERLKSKKDKELLLAEKRIVDEELKNADTALHLFTENLREKNTLIEKFKLEIDRLNQKSTSHADAGHLEKLLQAHIMTDGSWNDFKKLFIKVHPGFFVNLGKSHPHLSATDIRMLALIKLGLTNNEMANMLGITVEGIKKAKQRLRKKLDIDAIIEAKQPGMG